MVFTALIYSSCVSHLPDLRYLYLRSLSRAPCLNDSASNQIRIYTKLRIVNLHLKMLFYIFV